MNGMPGEAAALHLVFACHVNNAPTYAHTDTILCPTAQPVPMLSIFARAFVTSSVDE